jgi:hypothetical protein
MTTIAYDGKTLAADRMVSECGSVYRQAGKIMTIPGGHIVCAGDMDAIYRFVAWVRKGAKGTPPNGTDVGGIMIQNGRLYTVESGMLMEVPPDTKLANGCGWQWAAAAMDFGLDAVEAVAYASTRDTLTGCGIDAVTITQPRRKPARKG